MSGNDFDNDAQMAHSACSSLCLVVLNLSSFLVDNSLTQILLEKLESCWLARWKGVLLGQSINEEHQEATVSAARQLQGKITNLCACPPDIQLLEVIGTIWSFL